MRVQFAITTALCFALTTSCLPTLCAGDTIYIGDSGGNNDSLNLTANWSNGLPGASQNVGIININTELSHLNVNTANNVTVNHSAGDIGDPNNEFPYPPYYRDATWQNSGAGTLEWNMTGGSVSNFRVLCVAGASTTTNISGGTLTASNVGGGRIQVNSDGTLYFTGDAVLDNGYFWASGSGVVNLLGGLGTNMSNSFVSANDTSLFNVGGSFSIQSWKSNGSVFRDNSGDFDILAGWSGNIVDRNDSAIWTNTEWINDLTTAGVTFDGTTITAGNFSDYLWVDANGSLHAIPEPSTLALAAVGLFGLAFCGWRRKRR